MLRPGPLTKLKPLGRLIVPKVRFAVPTFTMVKVLLVGLPIKLVRH